MTSEELQKLRTQALDNPDIDLKLPEDERRDRADEVEPGTELKWGDQTVTVLAPGSGKGLVLVAYDFGGNWAIGQAEIKDLGEVPAPRGRGTLRTLVETLKATRDTDELAALGELKEMLAVAADVQAVK